MSDSPSGTPAFAFADAIADAMHWPRSRPARRASGDPAAAITHASVCVSDAQLGELTDDVTHAAILATPPVADAGGGIRAGKRSYDPFVGDPNDVSTWRRAARPVFDAALLLAGGRGGFDEQLAVAAGCDADDLIPIRAVDSDQLVITVYVPVADATVVRDALFVAGAGAVGNYDRCSWSTRGTGTFRPGFGANPAIGDVGSFEQVDELRLEAVFPAHLRPQIVQALLSSHPYEVPAYHVVHTRTPSRVGFGRVARFERAAAPIAADVEAALRSMPGLVVGSWGSSPATDGSVAVTTGAVQDVLRELHDMDDLACVVASASTQPQLQSLLDRGVQVIAIDRSVAVNSFVTDVAGIIASTTGLPVDPHHTLSFPQPESPSMKVRSDQTWRLHFDGGSRGNPGPAAYGWVLYDEAGNEADADGVKIGHATNNVAEWTGLLRGIEHALQIGITRLDVRGDSELIIKQVTGVYRVKNAQLKPLADQVAALIPRFDRITFEHVYRTDNARADEIANEAMDGIR